MTHDNTSFETLRWIGDARGHLELIDQTLLPVECQTVACRDVEAVWEAMRGMRDSDYREEMVTGHMAGRDIQIKTDVGVGRGRATVWTCDLTHRYIEINADYRS